MGSGSSEGSVGLGPTSPCLSEEKAAEFEEEPLTATLKRFSTDYFDIRFLKGVSGKADVYAESREAGFIACTETEGAYFELLGGATSVGPLIIAPQDPESANYWPTVLQQSHRHNQNLREIPVFGKDEMETIFDDVGIEPDPERGHIVVEFVFVQDSERLRQNAIELRTLSGAVAYRNADEWSRDLEQTTGDGLAVALNVGALGGLGSKVDLRYVVDPQNSDQEITIPSVVVARGAVTYVALTPEGGRLPGF
jgi:hypothetical protein